VLLPLLFLFQLTQLIASACVWHAPRDYLRRNGARIKEGGHIERVIVMTTRTLHRATRGA